MPEKRKEEYQRVFVGGGTKDAKFLNFPAGMSKDEMKRIMIDSGVVPPPKDTKSKAPEEQQAQEASPQKERPAFISNLVDSYVKWEGIEEHTDVVGIKTAPFGIVNDTENHPEATKYNLKIAKKLGVDLNNTNLEGYKKVAKTLLEEKHNELMKELPEYSTLPEEFQMLVLDPKYNTGVTYKNLASALSDYLEEPDDNNKRRVVKESIRKTRNSKGELTRLKGLDNRAAKVLAAAGIISSVEEARKFGLTLATEV